MLDEGKPPQTTVIFNSAVIVGKVAGLIVITRLTAVTVLPQASVAVQLSVTVPPQAVGVAVNVEVLEVPLIKQLPDKLLL